MRKLHIYLVGIVLLGCASEYLKRTMMNGALFFGLCIVYVIALRLLAERFGKP